MNTTTKLAAPARNTLKVRTQVRAGYSFGATQTGASYVGNRAAGFIGGNMDGTGI